MSKKTTRREFLSQATTGTAAAAIGGPLLSRTAQAQEKTVSKATGAPATGRVLGANDRINFAFIGMGDRMGAHTKYLTARQRGQGDVQAVAVCDIYEQRKKRGQQETGVEGKAVYHDYRELCARKDVDAVVIATPDHWHARIALEALNQGKHVYLEKPLTYTIEEARELARKVKETGLTLQVGSQHASEPQYWKAREVIAAGMIGKVLWASASYARNTPAGEWNDAIDPDEVANERTIDWPAFLGSARKRPFDKDRFFRWRKYWDYSGGIATDLFYHRIAPLMLAIGEPEFPTRVTASGGQYAPVPGDIREVPDTYLTTVEFPGKYAIVIGSSLHNAVNLPQAIYGTQGTIYFEGHSKKGESSPEGSRIRVVAEQPYRKEFVRQHGKEELVIETTETQPAHSVPKYWTTGNHMVNFIQAARGQERLHFDVDLGYKAMVAIRLGVDAYRSGQTMYFDAKREKATMQPTKW